MEKFRKTCGSSENLQGRTWSAGKGAIFWETEVNTVAGEDPYELYEHMQQTSLFNQFIKEINL